MKLTFEGKTFSDILDQMKDALKAAAPAEPEPTNINSSVLKIRDQADYDSLREAAAPVDKPVDIPRDIPVDIPVEKPKPHRSEKQLAAAAKMRAAKQAKKAAAAAPVEMVQDMPMPPPPRTAAGIDPAELVRIRDQTLADLRAAHSGGFHREVAELLARFGNGAKSFRELQVEAFVPIREAIDNGALT